MEDKNKYYTFYVIKRIWKNYASGSMKLLLIALFCNAIVALTTPALPELIRRVIDDIFVNSNREMLTILPLIAILIMFIRALGTYGANVAINYIGQKIGIAGMRVIERMMGLILMVIAVQFIINGIETIANRII